MRIIVRHCLPFGNYSTQCFELPNEFSLIELKQRVADKFKLSGIFFLKFHKDGFVVRICDSFSLEFYDITEKTIIYIEHLQSPEELKEKEEKRITAKYLGRLGLLSIVNEEESKSNEIPSPLSVGDEIMMTPPDSLKSSELEDSGERPPEHAVFENKEKFNLGKYLEAELEKLLKAAKSKNMVEINNILTQYPDNVTETQKSEILVKKRNLFNELGKGGWNAFHFAIFFGHNSIVKELLQKGADINKTTTDGWNPLLLAINRNNLEIFNLLLKSEGLRLDFVTVKGTALHLACRHGKAFVSALLAKNIDPQIKNDEGFTALELCNNEEIRKFLEDKIKELGVTEKDSVPFQMEYSQFAPPKPPIVMGWLFKTGPLIFNIKRRFFVLDPHDGTFIRFKRKEDYPLKPRAVIPLKDITNVQRIESNWMMKKELNYFEIVFSSNRKIYASNYQSTAKEWVSLIYKASVYSCFMEEQLKNHSDDLTALARFSTNYVNKPNDIYELPDIEREGDEKARLKESSPKGNSNSDKTLGPVRKTSLTSSAEKSPSQNKLQPSNSNVIPIEKKPEEKPQSERIGFKSFQICKILGAGSFGKVYLVKKLEGEKIFAMKALKKRDLIIKKQLRYAVTEVNVLKRCNHPFVLTLHYAFQTPQYVYMVLDYCPRGDLALFLAQKAILTEEEARFFICEMLLAVEHLHSLDIIYRDMKPENILIGQDGHIKLADFGLSKEKIGNNDATKSFCGSPAYLAPETLKSKGTGKAADLYGLGAVLYEMLTGIPPYYNDDIPKLYKNIQEAKLTFPENMSPEKLLDRTPEKRIGVKDKAEIRNHPFFNGIDWEKVLRKEYEPPEAEILDDEENFSAAESPLKDQDYEDHNSRINRVIDFSFERKYEIIEKEETRG